MSSLNNNLPYENIPEQFRGGLERYFELGIEPGHFLQAVLQNNLTDTVSRADDPSLAALKTIVQWLYMEAPGGSWGSADAYEKTIKDGGAIF